MVVVVEVVVVGAAVVVVVSIGTDEEQAALISDFVKAGFALRAIEERHSSFEEILPRIAEENHA